MEILVEAKLSRYWLRRAKSRARRHEREYPNKIDKAWALKQQNKWNKEEPELEEEYLKEIELAQGVVDSTKGYIEKIKQIREKRRQARKSGKLKSPYKNSKATKKYPYDSDRTGGVAKVYQKRSKRVGGATIAPGESFGPSIMESEPVKKVIRIRLLESSNKNYLEHSSLILENALGDDSSFLEDGTPVCEACLYESIMHDSSDALEEAEYQGRTVQLGKPTQGDVKKFKVYVRDPSTGNVKKVNFGDPNMTIKKNNPERRKSFRARHKCATAKDRTSARYWSCKKW